MGDWMESEAIGMGKGLIRKWYVSVRDMPGRRPWYNFALVIYRRPITL
jgi:hypothetical protein